MTVTVTFNVTMDPSIATETEASRSATQACFMGYVAEGKIISGNSLETSDVNVSDESFFNLGNVNSLPASPGVGSSLVGLI